jgi:hypothetical protein
MKEGGTIIIDVLFFYLYVLDKVDYSEATWSRPYQRLVANVHFS